MKKILSNNLEKLMFRKTYVLGHFGQIRPFPLAESGQNCQNVDLHTEILHMSLFAGIYDHPLQRHSLPWKRIDDGPNDGRPTFGVLAYFNQYERKIVWDFYCFIQFDGCNQNLVSFELINEHMPCKQLQEIGSFKTHNQRNVNRKWRRKDYGLEKKRMFSINLHFSSRCNKNKPDY